MGLTYRARVNERLPVHTHIPALPASALEAFSVGHVQVDTVEAAQAVRSRRQDAAGQAARMEEQRDRKNVQQ